MGDWRTSAISRAEERSAAFKDTRTLRSWPYAISFAIGEAAFVIAALMLYTDAVEAKHAFIGFAAAAAFHGATTVAEYIYRRWRVRADILTNRLVRANQEYDRIAARLPQAPEPILRVVHGDGRWAIEAENNGGPGDLVGRIEIVVCSVEPEAAGRGRALRWTNADSRNATVDRVRLLTSQVAQCVIGTFVDYGDSCYWALHSGLTLLPRGVWKGDYEGPPAQPDLVYRFWVKDEDKDLSPAAVVRITISADPPLVDKTLVRYYTFGTEGLAPVNTARSSQ